MMVQAGGALNRKEVLCHIFWGDGRFSPFMLRAFPANILVSEFVCYCHIQSCITRIRTCEFVRGLSLSLSCWAIVDLWSADSRNHLTTHLISPSSVLFAPPFPYTCSPPRELAHLGTSRLILDCTSQHSFSDFNPPLTGYLSRQNRVDTRSFRQAFDCLVAHDTATEAHTTITRIAAFL